MSLKSHVPCQHKNLYENYYYGFACWTTYCHAQEVRCKDCGMFITSCGCGFNNGESGWSETRWNKFRRKQNVRKPPREIASPTP